MPTSILRHASLISIVALATATALHLARWATGPWRRLWLCGWPQWRPQRTRRHLVLQLLQLTLL